MQEWMNTIIKAFVEADNSDVFYFGLALLLHAVEAIGLYALAKRRGLAKSWLAAVPAINGWILGSLSDQYRMLFGKKSQFGKIMLILAVALLALVVIWGGCTYYTVEYTKLEFSETVTGNTSLLLTFAAGGFISGGALIFLGIAYIVLRYICAYSVFASCDPERKHAYLIVCIILPVLLPVAIFLCRKKDQGLFPLQYSMPTNWNGE